MSRSEGHAVVAADVGGQTALAKKPLKYSKSVVFSGGGKGFTGEKKTAGVVGDGQWVAVLVISQQELAFVVSAPQLVGNAALRKERFLAHDDAPGRGARPIRDDPAPHG